jgi:hypothetical protein
MSVTRDSEREHGHTEVSRDSELLVKFSKYSVRVVRTCSGRLSCECILYRHCTTNCCTVNVITESKRIADPGLMGYYTVASGKLYRRFGGA